MIFADAKINSCFNEQATQSWSTDALFKLVNQAGFFVQLQLRRHIIGSLAFWLWKKAVQKQPWLGNIQSLQTDYKS